MIDSNFLKLCCSIEVHSLNRVVDQNYQQCGSNEICQTTLKLKTDSNVELDRHVRNKYSMSKSKKYTGSSNKFMSIRLNH